MIDRQDRTALDVLSDALADAASLHRTAVEVADDINLRAVLAARAERLELLSADVRGEPTGDEAGSMLRLLDQLRLTLDQWFGDDDEAADTASRDAKRGLLALIDDYLASPELSAEARSVFKAVRAQITRGRIVPSEDEGLKTLPS